MAKDLTSQQLQAIAKELDIKTPIVSYRVVGDRVELHLLGGQRVIYDPAITAVEISSLLSDLTVKELRLIAQDLDVSGNSKMTKAALVKALSDLNANDVADSFVKLNF